MKGETVDGVRISQNAPRMQKPNLLPAHTQKWSNAIKAVQRDGDLSAVLERCVISEENQARLLEEANA